MHLYWRLWRMLTERDYAAASWRWWKHNRLVKAKGCPCGAPAQVAAYSHAVMGAVPVEWWTCTEHASHPSTDKYNYTSSDFDV